MYATLLSKSPDRPGIVEKIAHFISSHKGNIVRTSQHADAGYFLSRVEWDLQNFTISRKQIKKAFAKVAKEIDAEFEIYFSDTNKRVCILVSKEDHCLEDLLTRERRGELPSKIVCIISNHNELKSIAKKSGIPFFYIPVKDNDPSHEKRQLAIIKRFKVDTIVLAKYMRILSADFIKNTKVPIINIHHSFLPDFAGGHPYKRAYDRGVKMIGATAHYATADLDGGPIIDQDTTRVTHIESLKDFIRKGRDMERLVLARALRLHLEHKVIIYNNRTAILE